MALQLNLEAVDGAPVPAATVMVLRAAATAPEVLMLRRHVDSAVLGGAFVFPGGKVDPRQDQPAALAPEALRPWARAIEEPDLAPEALYALLHAAWRETFEEAGLLLGHSLLATQRDALRAAAADAGFRWSDGLPQVTPQQAWTAAALRPWSRWITPHRPSVTRKRFDTRFLIARAPANQGVHTDQHEAVEARWFTPEDGLRAFWNREIDLAPPQILSLSHLAHITQGLAGPAALEAVWAWAEHHPVRCIAPEPFDRDGVRVTTYPGDPDHPDPNPAWPGPSRLSFRQGRFEPDGGWDALVPAGR